MDWDDQQRLEVEIDRELKRLPELVAPQKLAHRVMAAIAQRRALPWYRQPWQVWPAPLRIGALVFLLGSFGGLCFASWELTRAAGFTAAMQEVGQLFSWVTAIWSALNALALAAVLIVKHLGTGFMAAIAAAMAFGYAICLGLGTAVVRLALAQRNHRSSL
jgi:predicted lysophospholipase L1 biosynthesis ABC-type transport system permease subunit